MTITVKNCQELARALQMRGFLLVADLPRPLRIDIRRGVIIARMP
ncbi:hypothetical protein SAMN05216178_4020 [Pseudomonas saponiphila]|uniref:Uncharacterized protein n=1 Tax=Pseudomonas saponiphila TaxID=556534 RepID=A0A1H4R363_9PSED|nr:hypothetical protein SAMN05216178_4020 [Pseudomonas saponiphila]